MLSTDDYYIDKELKYNFVHKIKRIIYFNIIGLYQ